MAVLGLDDDSDLVRWAVFALLTRADPKQDATCLIALATHLADKNADVSRGATEFFENNPTAAVSVGDVIAMKLIEHHAEYTYWQLEFTLRALCAAGSSGLDPSQYPRIKKVLKDLIDKNSNDTDTAKRKVAFHSSRALTIVMMK